MTGSTPHPKEERKTAGEILEGIEDLIRRKEYDAALQKVQQALWAEPHNPHAISLRDRITALKGGGEISQGQQVVTVGDKESIKNRKLEKLRELEEERRRLERIRQEFEELQRKEEELQREEEQERSRRVEEQKQLEERRRHEAEERRKQEELKKKDEERKRLEEMRRKKEEEERRKREEDERRKQEELNKKREEERQRKIEELQSQLDALKNEEEEKKRQTEESQRRRQEEEERLHQERLRREEMDRQRDEEERQRQEQRRRVIEEERKKIEELKQKEREEQKNREEELRRREMEHMIQMDPMRRLEMEARLAKEKKERPLAQITVAEELFTAGSYDQALADVTKILEIDPSFARALTLRLRIKQAQERKEERPPEKKTEKADPLPPAPTAPPVQEPVEEKGKSPLRFLWIGIVVFGVITGAIIFTHVRDGSASERTLQNNATESHGPAKPPAETHKSAGTETKSAPSSPSVTEHLSRANSYVQRKAYQSALQEYDDAIALDPNRTETYLARASVDLVVGKYSDAISALSHATDLSPRDTLILLMTAYAHQLNHTLLDGFKYHELVLSLVGDSNTYLTGPIADAILYDNSLLSKYGERTRRAFEQILNSHPGDYVNRYRCARLLLALGRTNEANDLFQRNVDFLVEEFRNRPDDGRLMMFLALALTRLGHSSEAAGFAADARELSKAHPEILYEIAQMYSLQMRTSEAKGVDAQMKKNSLQALHEAVGLRFMLNEISNADFINLYAAPEFAAAVRLQTK